MGSWTTTIRSLEFGPESYRDWSLEQFGGCALCLYFSLLKAERKNSPNPIGKFYLDNNLYFYRNFAS